MRLAGTSILITGASAGIGRACALALAAEGAEIVATGRRQAQLDSLLQEIAGHGGKARAIAGDLTDRAFVAALTGQAGDCDILINNAGILTYAPFLDLPPDEIDRMIAVNLTAPLHLTQQIAARMAARGRGHIIMITSGAARTAVPLGLVYSATKHALSAAARTLRIELRSKGVKISEIAPGSVDTEIRASSSHPAYLAKMAARDFTVLAPEDVASAVVYAATAADIVSTNLIEVRSRHAPSA